MSAQIILTLTRPKNGSVLSKSEQEWSVRSRGFKKIGFILKFQWSPISMTEAQLMPEKSFSTITIENEND